MKRTPSKRKSHIERIQEENKELLKSMGIEELAASESRSTRRSTRSNTKGPAQAPVTPPTPKRQPATPNSSRRGKNKKDEDDETLKNEVTAESSAVEISSPIQQTPPRKRQKLSETTTEGDSKNTAVEEQPKKASPAEETLGEKSENTLELSANAPSEKPLMTEDSAKVSRKSAENPIDGITDAEESSPAIVVREPMPDIESAKIEESFEQQISSTSEKLEEAPLVDQGEQEKVSDVVADTVAEPSTKSPKPIVEAVKADSEPTQVFEISSENRSQVLDVEKALPLESITEQSKIETTQGKLQLSCTFMCIILYNSFKFQMSQFQLRLKLKKLSKFCFNDASYQRN